MLRNYSVTNRLRNVSHEASVEDSAATLFMRNIDLHLGEYTPIIEKLKTRTPAVKIEVLKKCSYLGRLTLTPSFTLGEYCVGVASQFHRERLIISEVTIGWHLKDALKYLPPLMYDQIEQLQEFHSVTIGFDGRSWYEGYSAYNADEPTFGVFGSGNFLQSFAESDPNDPGIKTPGNISSVNNSLSRLIAQEV